jgi:hypothetical protein
MIVGNKCKILLTCSKRGKEKVFFNLETESADPEGYRLRIRWGGIEAIRKPGSSLSRKLLYGTVSGAPDPRSQVQAYPPYLAGHSSTCPFWTAEIILDNP